MMKTPFQQIKELLSNRLPPKLISYLPTKWEKIGDILVIKLPNHLEEYKKEICEKYAKTLCCKTVLVDLGISGDYREPKVEKVYGSSLETIHLENGVRFKLDASRIMFSSGNLKERIRMASISSPKETVVDLFAGIGYFTLPIAVHSKPKKIFACEINPIAYNYLCQI
jgi:tRNA wybutosine-synthesizing protein 2